MHSFSIIPQLIGQALSWQEKVVAKQEAKDIQIEQDAHTDRLRRQAASVREGMGEEDRQLLQDDAMALYHSQQISLHK